MSDHANIDQREIQLTGGRANVGGVVRIGGQVARPEHPQTPNVTHYLEHLLSEGVDFVPRPLGTDDAGRQRLTWIEGVAPTSPYPSWAFEERLLVDVAQHQQRLHAASESYEAPATGLWAVTAGDYFPSASLDPETATTFCHNDLCMSNIIVDTEAGSVAGIIDFDYVRRVDPLFDIAVMARHWVPFGDPTKPEAPGLELDLVRRFRAVADVHDLSPGDTERVVDLSTAFLNNARSNVRALADAGGAGFQALIDDGYEATNQATVDWLTEHRSSLASRR